MKKLFLSAAVLATCSIFAQAAGDLFIQNYTPHYVEYTIVRLNQANTVGCSPSIEGTSTQKLTFSTNPSITAAEAYYQKNINTSNTFNPAYPNTPLIPAWVVNSSYPATPLPFLPMFSNLTDWSLIKFGIQNQSGVNIGGWYTMGRACNGTPINDLSGYTNPAVNGSFFTMGGATWIVIY